MKLKPYKDVSLEQTSLYITDVAEAAGIDDPDIIEMCSFFWVEMLRINHRQRIRRGRFVHRHKGAVKRPHRLLPAMGPLYHPSDMSGAAAQLARQLQIPELANCHPSEAVHVMYKNFRKTAQPFINQFLRVHNNYKAFNE